MVEEFLERISELETELEGVKKENEKLRLDMERKESQTDFLLHNKYFPSRPNSGLYGKYIVSKSDGSEVDSRAEYFVLRIDSHQSDREHTYACRTALMAFAFATCNPDLAKDIVNWVARWKKHDKENGILDEGQEEKISFSVGDLEDFFEGFYAPKARDIKNDAENGLFEKVTSGELEGLAMESAFADWKNAMLSVVMGDLDSEIPEL